MDKESKKPELDSNTAQSVAPTEPMQAQQATPTMTQPQYGQQPQVQYVVMQQSLKGVGGWLIFWLICFAMAALIYIFAFFGSMMVLSTAVGIVGLIFSPLLAGGYIATTILIAMQKRLARLMAFITLGVSAVYTIILNIVTYVTTHSYTSSYSDYSSYSSYSSSSSSSSSIPLLIAGILASLVCHGLIALYFVLSKRVKETLVN